jgi:acylphosphatase
MNRIRQHLIIKGHVQGVGFRYSLLQLALKNHLTGWVRNRRDGSVEAMLMGDENNVQRVIEWAKTGPSFSQVDEVISDEGFGEYDEFSIKDTV